MLSTPRVSLGHQCKARFAANGSVLSKKRNAAVMTQGQPNVNIISTWALRPQMWSAAAGIMDAAQKAGENRDADVVGAKRKRKMPQDAIDRMHLA